MPIGEELPQEATQSDPLRHIVTLSKCFYRRKTEVPLGGYQSLAYKKIAITWHKLAQTRASDLASLGVSAGKLGGAYPKVPFVRNTIDFRSL